jgi:hypothetical protein
MRRALARTNFVFVEQIALNYAIFTGAIEASFLPATYNWLCGDAMPMWDERRACFVEPHAPHAPLGILHLAGEDQKTRVFPVKTLAGGTIETRLTHSARPGRAPAAVAAPA